MPTTAVIYCRQSKEVEESTSVEDQERLCRDLCEREGWSVAEVVVDRDTPGSERLPWRRRKNFPRVFDIDCDVLVVYRWARLSREESDQFEIVKAWGALGRELACYAEPVDASTASGQLSRGLLFLIAAHQARQISEQWKETHARRVANGLPKNGQNRFGYVKDGKHFKVDPVTGPVLRDMYLRYTAGAGVQTIRDSLNERGVRTTRNYPWSSSTVSTVLDSAFGAGLLKHADGTYTEGAHEAVITEAEWQAFLVQRSRRKLAAPRLRLARWHLAGIAVCGECGASMQGKRRYAECGTYHNYGKGTCAGVWVNRTWMEDRVAFWIGGHLENLPERAVESSDAETLVRDLESSLNDAQAALGRLAEGYATGLLDADAYRAAQATLTDQRAQVQRRLQDAREEAARVAPVDNDIFARLEVGDHDTGEWNALLKRVLRRVEAYKDRIVIVPVVGEAQTIPR